MLAEDKKNSQFYWLKIASKLTIEKKFAGKRINDNTRRHRAVAATNNKLAMGKNESKTIPHA